MSMIEVPAGFSVEWGYSEAVCDYTETNYFSTFEEAEEFAKTLNGDCHIMENFHYYDDDDYDEDEFYFPDCGDWEDEYYEEDVPQEDNKSSLDEELDYWVKELESMTGGV